VPFVIWLGAAVAFWRRQGFETQASNAERRVNVFQLTP
jgi:hypothetical protein